MDVFTVLQNQLGLFLLIFTRMSGLFVAAPVFGSRNLPLYTKAGLCVLLSYVLFPVLLNSSYSLPNTLLPFVITVFGELVVGWIIGFASSLVFSAVQMAGQLLDMQIGFGVISVIDPQSGQQVPLVGNFKYILALLTFLGLNGHHVLLSALFSSFKLIPITGVIINTTITEFMLNMVSETFVIAIKISLPVLASALLTDVALGILARTMPQMNIFVVGVPGKIIIGLFMLTLALPVYIIFLEVAFNGMYRDIYLLLEHFR